MTALVPILQILSGLAWMIPAAIFTPGAIRLWTAKATAIDGLRFPIWLNAVVQAGFTVRWLAWPHTLPSMGDNELAAWAALYAMSALSAIGLVVSYRYSERMR